MEVKQSQLKQLVKLGIAIDATESEEIVKEKQWQVIAYSKGIYGINGCLIQTKKRLYAITARSSSLFYFI